MCLYFVGMVVFVSVVCINFVVLCVMLDSIIVVLWERCIVGVVGFESGIFLHFVVVE